MWDEIHSVDCQINQNNALVASHMTIQTCTNVEWLFKHRCFLHFSHTLFPPTIMYFFCDSGSGHVSHHAIAANDPTNCHILQIWQLVGSSCSIHSNTLLQQGQTNFSLNNSLLTYKQNTPHLYTIPHFARYVSNLFTTPITQSPGLSSHAFDMQGLHCSCILYA